MVVGVWILGDRLNRLQSSLESCHEQKEKTPVIFIESSNYVKQRPYHQQKLVLVWSAMRHFAEELKADNWQVTYAITEDFATPLQEWIQKNKITELRITTPCDRTFLARIQSLSLDCKITLLPDNHFLWSRQEFQDWAKSRKRLLMEDFYREGRKRFNILMSGKDPIGGKWNYDKQNRKPPKKNLETPERIWFEPDNITQEVINWIQEKQFSNYGEITPFQWGVTREQALQVLEHFITECLPSFGTYQDAMVTGEYTIWHGLISPYLNLGLLQPLEVINAVEKAYYDRELPLNSVEGFIRQVLGWREYMHGLYYHFDADYSQNNWFEHDRPLPEFFWDSSQTNLNCLKQTLIQTEKTGYAHHIQRLMILANFALITGINPQEIESWFHSVFIDAYDWVMQTNVIGMGIFADGGMLASKPYAALANYINKMSDYCSNCQYNKSDRLTEKACPFNYFYWDFIARHRDKLKSLGRMNLILGNLKKISEEDLKTMQELAQKFEFSK
ncbi:(6-4) photolyase [Hyella patelloides LEGE 07179]|uniref:(6-4) photolyase n=1 Tax=Hyella patelloides LEGE 07179 TaxID=945734 RepID=A0A563W496_9CYAN|nr:cryptochrome/photolyase family protein [Hyella patelloides]VEP18486.1 (6-4) photolyase [Hyella patelloides LEGE 07179]